MSGIRVASPIVNILNVLSMLIGVGGATLVSVYMGKRQQDQANRMFSLSIVLSIVIGAAFAIVVAPLSPAIASLISSDSISVEYTSTFLQIVTAASPVYILASVMAMLLRSDACIKLSSIVLAVAGVANVAFDFLFIAGLNLGVAGSALATDTGMLVAVLLSLLYFRWEKRTIKLVNPFKSNVDDPESTSKSVWRILNTGAASGLRMLLACLALLFLNYMVGSCVGVYGIALMTICGNLQLLAVAVFSGSGQAATPLEGVLFGEGNYSGIRLLFKYVLKMSIILVSIIIVIICIFPGLIISLFCPSGLPLENADWLLRLYSLGFLPLATSYILTYYYNTIGQKQLSISLTACENLIIYVPMIWILTSLLGLPGTIIAFVVSEFLTVLVAYLLARRASKKQGFPDALLLPKEPTEVIYEATSEITQKDAVALAKEIRGELENHEVNKGVSLRVAMAIEESIIAAANRGADKSAFADIRLLNRPEECVISIRDNADLFDPKAGDEESSEEFSNAAVLNSISSSVDYANVLGLNQTIVKISKTGKNA